MPKLVWILVAVSVAVAAGYAALQWAIARDGAAVLSGIDRMTGGEQGTLEIERAQFGASPAQKLSVWRRRGAHPPMPVMVFVHGGSWASGDPDSYGFIGRNFAARGFLTILAGYRLYPDAQYPAMLEDAAAAVAWVHANAARLGGDPNRIWIMGHSAGAYNAIGIALDRRWLDGAGVPEYAIAGAIGLAGPYDFYPFDKDSSRNSFGSAPDPEDTQPINHVRPDAPPLLLLAGEEDATVKPRNTRALAKALNATGGSVESEIYAGMDHSAPLISLANPWLSRRPVMHRILAFTDRHAQDSQAEPARSSLAVQTESR